MALAPLSVVQVVLSGGLVLLAVMADRLFGFKVGKRQWWGLGMTFLGLVLLALTLPSSHGAHSAFSVPAMAAFEAGLLGLGALFIMGPRLGGNAEHHGVMLAAAAGILFGVCNLGVKALTGIVGDAGAARPRAQPVDVGRADRLGDRLLRLGALAAGRRGGRVIAITGTAANIATIAGGIIVFGDPLPGDTLGIIVQAHRLRARDRRLGADARAGARPPRAPPAHRRPQLRLTAQPPAPARQTARAQLYSMSSRPRLFSGSSPPVGSQACFA